MNTLENTTENLYFGCESEPFTELSSLRPGNWVSMPCSAHIGQVEDVLTSEQAITSTPDDCMFAGEDRKWEIWLIHPMILTEQLIQCLGFKRIGQTKDFACGGVFIHTRKKGFMLNARVGPIKHVHQLQNLYHALTGKELTAEFNQPAAV